MKREIKKYLFFSASALLLLSILVLNACKDKPEGPSEEEVQLQKLSKVWNLASVSLDGADPGVDYANFRLTLSGTVGAANFTYSTQGRPIRSPWPGNGTWRFGAVVASQIIRDAGTNDELPLSYSISQDGNSLEITFNFSGEGYTAGRLDNVSGNWRFTFN
ncbi:MAG TPA: hypothetical protein PKC24_12245 [Cyclobacteriaceae bacterium]|nr:hypothetical protein [Cyclobacteriaceae bacterium]